MHKNFEENKLEFKKISERPYKQIMYVAHAVDNVNNLDAFFGGKNDNPMKFIKACQQYMGTISDSLSETDKIEFVGCQLKGTAGDWFSIINDDLSSFDDFISHFKARYWNVEIQSRIWDQIDHGTYTPDKGNKENYILNLMAKARYLEPEIHESFSE